MKDTKAYVGYKGKFIFAADSNNSTRPRQDKIANHFKEITNTVAFTILKGNTVGEALKRSRMATIKIIEHLETREFTPEMRAILPYLYLDLFVLDLQGDPEART